MVVLVQSQTAPAPLPVQPVFLSFNAHSGWYLVGAIAFIVLLIPKPKKPAPPLPMSRYVCGDCHGIAATVIHGVA